MRGVTLDLDSQSRPRHFGGMTVRKLEKQVMELSPESRVRLAEKIIESVEDFTNPEVKLLWDEEISERVASIHARKEKGVPGAQVIEPARRALNETRRVFIS